MDLLKQQLVEELFTVWAIYFAVAALLFSVLTGLIVWWISRSITEPIVTLNKRINHSINSVKQIKENWQADNKVKRIDFQSKHLFKGF